MAAIVLALPVALASLPFFAFGYWNKAQLFPILVQIAGALGAVGLIVGVVRGDDGARAAVGHPQTLVPTGLAVWSAISAPFVDLPVLSLAGTVQSGFGALWFFNAAVLIACALVVRRHPGLWKAVRWWAVAVGLVVAGIKVHDWLAPHDHLLLFVAAYYGWMGLGLAALSPGDRGQGSRWLLPVIGGLVGFALVVVSQSLTAIALAVGGLVFVVVAWLGKENALCRALTASRGAAVTLVGAVAVAPYVLLKVVPELGAIESLRDRQLLQKMMHAALGEQPVAAWLLGNGWGRTQDAFHANLGVTGENLWQPTWIFLESDYFHAHNWMLESLYAAGIPGLILFFLTLMAIPLFAAPSRRPIAIALAVALAGMSALWFPLILSVPFIALAIAAISDPDAGWRVPGRPVVAVLASGALALVAIGGADAWFIRQVEMFRAGERSAFPTDPRGSDLTASSVFRDDFFALAAATDIAPGDRQRALAMVAHLAERVERSTSSHFLVTAVNSMSRVYSSGELAWLAPSLTEGRGMWRSAVDRLLVVSPGRSDVLIPYLAHHAVTGDLAETARVTALIRQHSPGDPVGLYFTGLLLVLDPSQDKKRQGIDFLRASVEAGIERFMPLDPVVRGLITDLGVISKP